MNRRQYIRCAGLATAAIAGCGGASIDPGTSTTATSSLPPDATISGWPMRGNGPAHTAGVDSTPTLEGTRRWEFQLPKQPQTGPTVGGDIITIGTGQAVIAVSPDTGTELWRTELDAEITGQPIIHKGRVFVGTDELGLYGIDGRSGAISWQYSFDRDFDTHVNTPAVAGERVMATVNGEADTPTVLCVGQADGQRHWQAIVLEEPSDPVVARDELFTYGVVQSVSSGEVLRQQSLSTDHTLPPAVTSSGVFIVEAGTRLHRLPQMGATPAWTVSVDRQSATMPVVANDQVYLSGRAMDIETGDTVFHLDTETRCPPALTPGLGMLSRRQEAIAFDPETGDIRWTDDIPQVTRPKQPALTSTAAYVAAGDRLIAYE